MKSRVVLLVVALIVLAGILIASSYMKEPEGEGIYGVWEGVYQGDELSFTFNTDGTCLLSFNDNVTGETEEIRGTFELNLSKNPIPLSINNIPQITNGLYTIIEFTDEDSLKIADFSPRWRLRPLSFESGTYMRLKRVQGNGV